jgi:hypothetical protein
MGKLVAFCGQMGAGKDTAANALADNYARVNFADPLKGMLAFIGVPYTNLHGTQEQKAEPLDMLCGQSARRAMQLLGTEFGRQLHPDLWVTLWAASVEKAWDNGIDVVCTDLRFPNEFEAVRKLGGKVIRVDRPGSAQPAAHASEAHFMSMAVDAVVMNDSTKLALVAKARAAVKQLFGNPSGSKAKARTRVKASADVQAG